MEKKAYNKPELTVVKLTSMSHLLAGSDFESGGEGPINTNTSRSASLSTYDREE